MQAPTCSEGFALHSLFCRRRYVSQSLYLSLSTQPCRLLSFNAKLAQCLQTHGLFTEPYVYPQNVPCVFQTLSINTYIKPSVCAFTKPAVCFADTGLSKSLSFCPQKVCVLLTSVCESSCLSVRKTCQCFAETSSSRSVQPHMPYVFQVYTSQSILLLVPLNLSNQTCRMFCRYTLAYPY